LDGALELQPGDTPQLHIQIIPGMEGVAMALGLAIVLCAVVLVAWRK